MTIEEVIKELKDASYCEVRYGDKDNHYDKVMKRVEAFDMAIKALEQQLRDCKTCKHSDKGNCAGTEECHECMWESKYEQQTCEDCISLNKLDDIITKAIDESDNQTECQTLRWVLDVMSELPSVTPNVESKEGD